MITKSNIKYKIDTLLRMASITDDDVKRKEYLSQIEELLDCEDMGTMAETNICFGSKEEMNIVIQFVEHYGISQIDGRRVSSVYKEYQNFCHSIKHNPISNCSFGKYITRCGANIYSTQKWIDGKNLRIYKVWS